MADPIAETWAIHNRINLSMLDAIPDEGLVGPSPHPGEIGSVLDGQVWRSASAFDSRRG